MNTELTFHYPHPPTSEEAIAAFEKELGYRLPEDYRQFLLKYNGGDIPNRHGFAYKLLNGKDMRSSVETFFGIGLEKNYQLMNLRPKINQLPDNFFVIAYALGSKLGIGIDGDMFGKVYVWENTVSDDILPVANSFSEFLDMLYEDES